MYSWQLAVSGVGCEFYDVLIPVTLTPTQLKEKEERKKQAQIKREAQKKGRLEKDEDRNMNIKKEENKKRRKKKEEKKKKRSFLLGELFVLVQQ